MKRDAFGRVELLVRGLERVVRRVACGGGVPGSRAVARLLLERERRALAALRGLEGVPALVDGADWRFALSLDGAPPREEDVLVRTFVAGAPLHRCRELPLDFFDRLHELVRELHARGVAHNDLHKEQNIVVGDDGWPWLIDFQLASRHALGSRALRVRAWDDLRHVAKHRRRYLRYALVADEHAAPAAELRASPPRPPRRSSLALVWRRTAKPVYNLVTRDLLGRRDGEERRETRGQWPIWVASRGPRPHRMSSR